MKNGTTRRPPPNRHLSTGSGQVQSTPSTRCDTAPAPFLQLGVSAQPVINGWREHKWTVHAHCLSSFTSGPGTFGNPVAEPASVSDRALGAQRGDLGGVEIKQVAQDQIGVLTQQWRGGARRGRGLGEVKRRADQLDL